LAEVRDKKENLNRAIGCFEKALRMRTEERFPVDFAMTQSNLGIAYIRLAEVRDKEENLKRAIGCFEKALRIYAEEHVPVDFAVQQSYQEALARISTPKNA